MERKILLSKNPVKKQLLPYQTFLRRLSTKTRVQVSEQAYSPTFHVGDFVHQPVMKLQAENYKLCKGLHAVCIENSTQGYRMKIPHMEVIDNNLGLPFQPLACPNSSYKMSGNHFCEPTPCLPDRRPSSHDILVTSSRNVIIRQTKPWTMIA